MIISHIFSSWPCCQHHKAIKSAILSWTQWRRHRDEHDAMVTAFLWGKNAKCQHQHLWCEQTFWRGGRAVHSGNCCDAFATCDTFCVEQVTASRECRLSSSGAVYHGDGGTDGVRVELSPLLFCFSALQGSQSFKGIKNREKEKRLLLLAWLPGPLGKIQHIFVFLAISVTKCNMMAAWCSSRTDFSILGRFFFFYQCLEKNIYLFFIPCSSIFTEHIDDFMRLSYNKSVLVH